MDESHCIWVEENVIDFGIDIKDTAIELEISFLEAVALYEFVLKINHYDMLDLK